MPPANFVGFLTPKQRLFSGRCKQSLKTPSNEGFRFLKLSEFKQLKYFVRIGQNFKAKMALNNKELHVTYIKAL